MPLSIANMIGVVGAGALMWTPGRLPLRLWARGDSLSASPVTSWPDKSGHGRALAQAAGAKQPSLLTSALNGFSAARFDGSDDYLFALFSHSAPLHVFLVARLNAGASSKLLFDAANATDYISGYQHGTTAEASPGALHLYSTAYGPYARVGVGSFKLIEACFNGAGSYVRINAGEAQTGNPGTLTTIPGFGLGGYFSGGYQSSEDVVEVVVTDLLTAGQRQALERYYKQTYRQTYVACNGNSITFGSHTTAPAAKSWPSIAAVALGSIYTVENYGVPGQTTAQMATYAATHGDVYRAGWARSISVGIEGTNSLYLGATDAQEIVTQTAWAAQQRAAGFGKVVGATVIADGLRGAQANTYTDAFNTYLRANYAAMGFDAIIDFAADARFQNSADTTYYDADTEHLNDTGQAVYGGLAATVIAAQ